MTAPAFKGGQGRSARSVREDGMSLAFSFFVMVAILACCVVAAWKGGR